jgi:glycosyltransferase involved in cell wall biosynthesis
MSEGAFAVVVPMFNEEQGALRCVQEIAAVLQNLPGPSYLIAVNDGSCDQTAQVLKSAQETYRALTVVTHEKNLGYGQALLTGGRTATGLGCDFVIFMDSDLTNDPRFISIFAEKIKEGCDLVKASRYIPGGGVENVPAWRYWISRVGNAVVRVLYGLPVSDCTNGFRAIRTDLLGKMQIRERGFPAIMEELYWAKVLKARVCEVPYVLTSRADTLRPSSFEYRPKVFYSYLKYPIMAFFRIRPSAA